MRHKTKEENDTQEEFAAWVNKEERIVTFRATEGFEMLTFRTQGDKMSYVYNLCESGYRIL